MRLPVRRPDTTQSYKPIGRRKLKAGQIWQKTSSLYSDKAYPDLDNNARKTLALNAYLGLLDNPQVSFGVKQRTPANLDAAIAATLELESYLSHKAIVSSVKEESTDNGQVGAVSVSNDKLVTLVEKLIKRVEKLEVGRFDGIGKQLTRRGCQENGGARQGWRENELNTPKYRGIICWNCGKRGHITRLCKSPGKKLQEN